ncbi:MAG: hypothetical protein ISS57_02160 [Anaerolineales bacterium]|nr:hypothetical protein [Anaerolineales bacterium]
MKRFATFISILLLLSLACTLSGFAEGDVSPDENIAPAQSENRCGDGICDGPENAANCAADCTESSSQAEARAPDSVCALPNPQRAVVSQELLEFNNYYADSSFEDGTAEVIVLPHQKDDLQMASVKRDQAAAHSGDWGYLINAGPNQGATFGAKGYIEKGEELHFSAWVRVPDGSAPVTPMVFWVENENDLGIPTRGETVTVGQEWTQVQLKASTTKAALYALLTFEVGPETTLHIDDVEISVPLWRMAEYEGQSRTVGGVTVPAESAAVTHFNIVIHIEDPNLLHNNRAYFEQQTAIFTELAKIIHKHGGFLTIQPEQDWPQAAEEGFHPGLLAELAQNYNVVYSNHTHGPNCIDPQGIPRSSADCNTNPGWDRNITDDDMVIYAQNMRQLFESASGVPVTDHNGNFDFTATSRFSEAGIKTLSVFKDKTTQSTYDRLINNPWRPGQGNALENLENFLSHDPNTQIIYIPGWGQALTRHPQRVTERIRPMLSQVIRFADPQRVNSFYVITHVGHFYSRTGDLNYLHYNESSGQVEYSVEFLEHLNDWDKMLSEVIVPLVEGGYLQWTSITDIGELFEIWETGCEDG